MKRNLKFALLILLCVLLIPFELFFRTITGIMIVGTIGREIECYTMRKDIFEYVLENKDSIELEDPRQDQKFRYHRWALADTAVEYGYYYTPHPEQLYLGKEYRKGYLDKGFDYQIYSEEICDNWFYYRYSSD